MFRKYLLLMLCESWSLKLIKCFNGIYYVFYWRNARDSVIFAHYNLLNIKPF